VDDQSLDNDAVDEQLTRHVASSAAFAAHPTLLHLMRLDLRLSLLIPHALLRTERQSFDASAHALSLIS
jgi:hypothetical protein